MREKITFNEAFLNQLAQLHMGIRFKLYEGMQGNRKSMAKGSSLEFSDFRDYAAGDDFRRIDWPSYARLDKLSVKVFMEEQEAYFNIFLDHSASMSYGAPTKAKAALEIAGALGYIIAGQMDRVSLYASDCHELTLNHGKQGFFEFLGGLSQMEFEGAADFGQWLLKQPLRHKGVSILISDFLYPSGLETLERALAYFKYKRQHLILIQVINREEKEPQELGDFELIDSESQQHVRVTITPELIKRYNERFKAHQNQLETLALKYQAGFVQIEAEKPIEEIILKEFYHKQIVG